MSYKVIQMTNQNISAITAGSFIPFGLITRKINCKDSTSTPFSAVTSGADTIIINEAGYYKVTYTGSLISEAVGNIILDLLVNDNPVFTTNSTAVTEGQYTISFTYEIRVCPNCASTPSNIPTNIQLRLNTSSVELTGGNSNILVEKVY